MTRSQAPLGSTGVWVRDLALIGAASSLAPAAVVGQQMPTFVAAAAVAGALTGAALGALLPRLLLGAFARWPIVVMLLVGAVLGAVWGGATGAIAGVAQAVLDPGMQSLDGEEIVLLGGAFGGVAGAFQLGWFWLPYTLLRARGRAAWPIVVAACGLSSALLVLDALA